MITDPLFSDLVKLPQSEMYAVNLASEIVCRRDESTIRQFDAAARYLDSRHALLSMFGCEDCNSLSVLVKRELKKLEVNFLNEL